MEDLYVGEKNRQKRGYKFVYILANSMKEAHEKTVEILGSGSTRRATNDEVRERYYLLRKAERDGK